jgi:hypothetical protein
MKREWENDMRRSIAFCAGGAVIAAGAMLGEARHAGAQALVENSAEFRMQLDFRVPDAALQKMLPTGWEPVIATQGPAKDCNIRLIFIDRVDVTGADNTPKTSSQLVYLAVPVKQTGTANAGQMIIAGLVADPKEAPGPFGNYTPATTAKVQRSVSIDKGVALGEENWEFAAANGERMEVHLKYERGPGRRNPTQEVKFFDVRNPSNYQIFKLDSGLDIMKNVSVPVKDRMKEFSYKVSGGNLGSLFDGTEKVLSWDSFHWYNRGIYTP